MKFLELVIGSDVDLLSLIVIQKEILPLRQGAIAEAAYHASDSLSVVQRIVDVDSKRQCKGFEMSTKSSLTPPDSVELHPSDC